MFKKKKMKIAPLPKINQFVQVGGGDISSPEGSQTLRMIQADTFHLPSP